VNIAFTGHRPNKLGGYDNNSNLSKPLKTRLSTIFISRNFQQPIIITGMALGVDTWAAEFAIKNNIPFHAYVPFVGQEKMWPAESQAHYKQIKECAKTVTYVCGPGYAAWKMQKRNEAMVDACDILIAVWDGTTGGTYNCIQYAKSKGKEIINIHPNSLA